MLFLLSCISTVGWATCQKHIQCSCSISYRHLWLPGGEFCWLRVPQAPLVPQWGSCFQYLVNGYWFPQHLVHTSLSHHHVILQLLINACTTNDSPSASALLWATFSLLLNAVKLLIYNDDNILLLKDSIGFILHDHSSWKLNHWKGSLIRCQY